MPKPRYTVDGEAKTYSEIIKEAEAENDLFRQCKIKKLKTVRHAVRILLTHGRDVKEVNK